MNTAQQSGVIEEEILSWEHLGPCLNAWPAVKAKLDSEAATWIHRDIEIIWKSVGIPISVLRIDSTLVCLGGKVDDFLDLFLSNTER